MDYIGNSTDVIYGQELIDEIKAWKKEIEVLLDDGLTEDGWQMEEAIQALNELEDFANQYPSPEYLARAIFINEDYWDEWVQEEAINLSLIPDNHWGQWPYTRIDWDGAAQDMLEDYVELDFAGTTYFAR